MYNYFIGGCIFIASVALMSCSDNDISHADYEIVTLLSGGDSEDPYNKEPAYKLSIPNSMVRGVMDGGNDTIEFRFLYPDIVGFTKDLAPRFYNDGVLRPEVVRVFLKHFSDNRKYSNDSGKLAAMSVEKSNYHYKAESPDEWKAASRRLNVTHSYYLRKKSKNDSIHIIKTDDGRYIKTDCTWWYHCNALTTWNGQLSVEYIYPKYLLAEQLINLDESIQNLIDRFNPIKINSNDMQNGE